jgi:hypothetical protein
MRKLLLVIVLATGQSPIFSQTAQPANPLAADVEKISAEINPQVVAWRRDFHKNP